MRGRLADQVGGLTMGDVADFTNFMGAVIDENAFQTHRHAIDEARENGHEIVAGGRYDDAEGYFVAPTVIEPGRRFTFSLAPTK